MNRRYCRANVLIDDDLKIIYQMNKDSRICIPIYHPTLILTGCSSLSLACLIFDDS